MEFSGQVNARELAEVLQMVASSNRPGRLAVTSGERRLSFHFSPQGVTLLSNDGLKSTELAAELAAEQVISPEQAAAALEEQEKTGGYLGEILGRLGAVPPEAVGNLVFREVQEQILAVSAGDTGTFEFSEGDLRPEVREQFRFATNFAFNPQHLLVEAARRLDERRRVEERIPSEDAILTRGEGAEAPGAAWPQGPVVTAVSVLVDGVRTVREIAQNAAFPRHEVFLALSQFLDQGLIRPATVEELLDTAHALTTRREFQRAARLYGYLAAQRPGDAVMPLKAGQLHERLGQTEEALAAYRRAVECLLASDMPGQAAGILDVMKRLDPDDLFALERAVNVRLAAGETAQAAADARRLADLLAKRGETAKAVTFAAMVADLLPEDAAARHALADLLAQSGKPSSAADELQKVALQMRQRRETGGLRRVLHEIEALDPGRAPVRRALRAMERPVRPSTRRWGRIVAVSAAAGLIAAGATIAVIYELEGRTAFSAVTQSADALVRQHRYDEAAALFATVARDFRYSSVAKRAQQSRREVLAQGTRYAAALIRAGVAAARENGDRAGGTLETWAEDACAAWETMASLAGQVLAAGALRAQAKRFEAQAKYAEARSLYAELVQKYPEIATYLDVELPLVVESVPLGARVLLNSQELGRTPLIVRHPAFGALQMVIEQPGFIPCEVSLAPDAKATLVAELDRRPVWVFSAGGSIESGAACDGPRVFVGSRDGRVYAVTAEGGQLLWKFDTGALGDVTCSPVVAGGMIFIGSHDHHVYALDSTTGRHRWQFRTGRLVRSTPCVLEREGLVLVGSFDRFVYALSAETGRLRWQFRTDGAVASSPVAWGDLVLVGSLDRRVYALRAATGAVDWRFEAGGAVTSSPVVPGDVAYFGADDGYVYALDSATGRVRWSFKTGGPIEGSPCARESRVYVGSSDGAVYALDAARGALCWKYQTQGSVRGAPAVSGGTLYVSSEDHCLHALDLATGSVRWKARASAPLVANPVIRGDLLFVGGKDGNLYAFRLTDAGDAPATAALEGDGARGDDAH